MKHESKTIIIDVDGVLVSHTFYGADGERFKSFHSRDNRAIKQMVADGYEVILMTASSWLGVFRFAEKVGAKVEITMDKLKAVQARGIEKFIAIADDAGDEPLLNAAEIAFIPGDSFTHWKGPGCNLHGTRARGGDGSVADMLHLLKNYE